jgi:hypothetical protein
MKSSLIIATLASALFTVTLTSPVLAATPAAAPASAAMKQPAKMTCEEFIALDDVQKPKVVYWAEGYSKKGKPVDAVVDLDETDRLIPILVTECKETPKLTLWQKIKKHL